jgi:hypothetical protein
LGLYERLHRIQEVTNKTIAKEAIESNSKSSSVTIISLSDDSLSDIVIDKDDVKTYHQIDVNGKVFEVPEPTPRTHKTWQKVLKHHENRLIQNLEALCQVEKTNDYKEVIKQTKEMVDKIVISVRSWERAEIMRRMLLIMMSEEYIYSQVGKVSEYLKDAKASIDSLSDGLWLDESTNPETTTFLENIRTQRIILSQKYQFDDIQTKQLTRLLFSSKPDVRAYAKLSLNAKLANTFSQMS